MVSAPPLHAEEAGSGRPVVLIHGFATSGRALSDVARALSADRRVVSVDLRGHGRSPPPAGPFSLEDHGADVAALVRSLGLERPVLLGWSLGAQVALAAAARLADARTPASGLALVAATARFTAAEGHPHGLARTQVDALAARMRIHQGKALARFFASCFTRDELAPDARDRAVARLAAEPPDAGAARGALDALREGDLRPVAGRIDVPVLLLHGEEDAIVPAGASAALAGSLARARRVTFPRTGHAPFLSRLADLLAPVRSFLAELP